jgi:putative flippase GtrA
MTERVPQAPVSPAAAAGLWRTIPEPVRRRLRTEGGRRLIPFAPAAVLAFGATQLTYLVLQLLNVTAGLAGAAGWLIGAVVSYAVSRWAWERRGRPDLLRETLPFAAISICVGIALTGASKLAYYEARVLGLHGLDKVVFAQGIYLAANCVTFVIRFLIFHHVLFADRGPAGPGAPAASAAPSGVESAELSELAGEPDDRGSSRARRLLSRSQVRITTRTKLSA